MSWVNLRVLGLIAIAAAAAAIFLLRQDNAHVRLLLDAANTQREAAAGQLATAQLTIDARDGQIDMLASINRQQARDMEGYVQRLSAITRNAAARAATMEAILHDDKDAQSWGAGRLPDAVVRLLDNDTDAADVAASAPGPGAGMPAGDSLQDAGRPADDKRAVAEDAAGHPDGAGNLRRSN